MEPVRIPLSVFQQARFAALRAEEQRLADRKSESVTTIIAGTYDPASFATWTIALLDTEIVCAPPAA